jgi:hypothetical protein
MTDWFRSWHGAPTDPKWVLIGKKAGIAPAVASAIAWALFDHASQASPRGSVAGFDCEVYAAWGGVDEESVSLAVAVMRERGMIVDGMLANWRKRQPEREDGSSERAKAWRERKKTEQSTPRTHPNASERIRSTDTDTDTEIEQKKEETRVLALAPAFKDFWEIYPNKVGKPVAEKAFKAALAKAPLETIMDGLRRYVGKADDRPWCNPATFLNQERWADAPALVNMRQGSPPASPSKPRNVGEFARQRLKDQANERTFDNPGFEPQGGRIGDRPGLGALGLLTLETRQ